MDELKTSPYKESELATLIENGTVWLATPDQLPSLSWNGEHSKTTFTASFGIPEIDSELHGLSSGGMHEWFVGGTSVVSPHVTEIPPSSMLAVLVGRVFLQLH